MQGYLAAVSAETRILLVLSIILFAGFIMTRLTNTLNLPKVSGYILAGILIGPCGLNMIPADMIENLSFVSDLALAFIAFGVGKFFKKEVIKKTGSKVLIVTFFEALTAGVLVTVVCRTVFRLDLDFALILGAIATATAPASTMMTINQYKAKGEFVNTLLQIVALDDVVCLLAFSIVGAVAGAAGGGGVAAQEFLLPVIYNVFALFLGFFCGYFLSRLLIPARSKDNRLILAIAMLTGISGICTSLNISPLLSCMVFGASYINLTRDKKLYRQLNNFTPPVMSLFFIVEPHAHHAVDGGRDRPVLLPCPHHRKICGYICGLRDYRHEQGSKKIYGACAGAAGGGGHWTGFSGRAAASGGARTAFAYHYSFLFRSL